MQPGEKSDVGQADHHRVVSVVVPTLNESAELADTLRAVLSMDCILEVIVVDGGSNDDTCAIAHASGAAVIRAPRGRGQQLHAGANASRGSILWFLHADTIPPCDGAKSIVEVLGDTGVIGGNFAIRFEGSSCAARFLTAIYAHLGRLGLRYGDSAFFMRRMDYDNVGGFRDLPIFEDLDLLRRLQRRGRFVRLPHEVIASSRRFEGRSFPKVFAKWVLLQLGYWAGISPSWLGKFYRPVRAR